MIHIINDTDHFMKIPALFMVLCHGHSTHSIAPLGRHGNTHEIENICVHAKNYQFLHYRHLKVENNILGLNGI